MEGDRHSLLLRLRFSKKDNSGCCGIPPPDAPFLVPSGAVETWNGLNVYVAGKGEPSEAALVLSTDVFGYEVPQTRVLGDFLAGHGFTVIIPDTCHGDPLDSLTRIHDWLPHHDPVAEGPTIKTVVDVIRQRFGCTKLGLMGFCWGAKVAMTAEHLLAPQVEAVVLAHPAFVTVEDMQIVKAPVAILAAEIDSSTPPALAQKLEAALKSNSNPEVAEKSFLKIFPGMSHGFTVRYDPNNKEEVKAAKAAHTDALNFFKSILLT